jgi:2-keto-3-deoxy-6-phosphogluconate aldolase
VNNAIQLRAAVSLYPCPDTGGPAFLKLLKHLYPKERFIPAGPPAPGNAAEYLREGALAVAPIIDTDKSSDTGELINKFLLLSASGDRDWQS